MVVCHLSKICSNLVVIVIWSLPLLVLSLNCHLRCNFLNNYPNVLCWAFSNDVTYHQIMSGLGVIPESCLFPLWRQEFKTSNIFCTFFGQISYTWVRVEAALLGLANPLDTKLLQATSPMRRTVKGRVVCCDWCLSICFMWLDKWDALAAVSQPVTDRLPQSTVKAHLCSWVTLTMSSSAEVSGQ